DNQQWYFQDTAVAVGITPELEIGNDPWVVYPNPLINTHFTVKGLNDFSSPQVRISIISLQGKVIFAKKFPVAETIQVDVDGIKPGSYIVRIQTTTIISQKQINIL
ncbi:MAG TPA: T9SS type A sorting domain-containing protein, partial [Bacteroidales bacterium]|nr:T9SS type A sorting domain-containing protein [Bacteroidales bacterium]